MSELRAAGEQPDDRPTWDVPHSVTIRCLRAAEDRIRAGESPAEVFADYGWTFAPDGPAEQPQPVARIVSSGPYADMPQLQWLSADHSFRAPIGTLLYPLLPAAPPPSAPQQQPQPEPSSAQVEAAYNSLRSTLATYYPSWADVEIALRAAAAARKA